MIKVRIQIPGVGSDVGVVYDTADKYGLVYSSSDTIFAPDIKGFESSSYPEQSGENVDPRTVDKSFDYKVKFFISTKGESDPINNANKVISAFNAQLFTTVEDSDIKTFKTITFYNDYKKVKIVGIPSPIKSASKFWRDSKGQEGDAVEAELVIRVSQPKLCDFNLQ